jgi:hypothetical protein
MQWAEAFDGGGIFQWQRQWIKARRRGQRETQQSNNSSAVAFDGDGNGAVRRQQDDCENLVEAAEADTADVRIELKRRIADGGCVRRRYRL